MHGIGNDRDDVTEGWIPDHHQTAFYEYMNISIESAIQNCYTIHML